jgi:hypothetical protein
MKLLLFPKPFKASQSRHEDCSLSAAMNKFLNKYVFTFPMAAAVLAFTASSFAYFEINQIGAARGLSGNVKEYELTLNSIKLDAMSRISEKENVFLRLRFEENNAFEIGRGQGWNLSQGGQIPVEQVIPVESKYINNDGTQFLLELVYEQNVWGVTKADVAILRCNTLAKELSGYNRSYQCFIPGEKTPVITYRLAEKGVPPPSKQGENMQVAGF